MQMRLKGIDPEVHRAFKVSCTAAGVTMTATLQEMMLDYVKRQGVVPVPKPKESAK